MTVAEIIAEAAKIYPTSRSSADQVTALSRIQRRLFVKLGIDSNQYTIDATDVTVADQEEYNFPTGCKIHSIVNSVIQVETTSTSSKYEDYEYRELNEITDYGNFYTRGSTSAKYYLYEDGEAIEDADRTIKIKFYKDPTIVDSTDDTPTLESEYHDYFVYALVADNASAGEDPDIEIANYWKAESEEYYAEIKYRMDDNLNDAKAYSSNCKEIM